MANNVVNINGASYTRQGLENLPRDPDLRQLARWVQENERKEVSRSWIGSMASKSDLVAFLMGDVPQAALARGSEAGDQKILTAPVPAANGTSPDAVQQALQQLLNVLGTQNQGGVKQEALDAMAESLRGEFEDFVKKGPRPVRIEIKERNGEVKNIGTQHKMFPEIMEYVQEREHIALIGPAGAGKSRVAHEIAKHLGLAFEVVSVCSQTTKSDILGYMDAQGRYVETQFRRRLEQGGVLLFDEFDSGNANVNTCINSGTSNDFCGFPDGVVKVHPDFVCILGMNTYGMGADRVYVGRNQLDGATMDRFASLDFDYDAGLELDIAPNREWTLYVQQVRQAISTLKIRHIVSPRASIKGGKMLNRGLKREKVEKAYIWKGLAKPEVDKIKAAVKGS